MVNVTKARLIIVAGQHSDYFRDGRHRRRTPACTRLRLDKPPLESSGFFFFGERHT
ncbi:hypothetical protein [Burkholderia sp. MSMB1072]|uniref:hypothetical protein n=1 Tax=Burkholderia sp. MSMB1072 TaxID=1637871 RepID=UPI0012E3DE10|nr:hypothetical protein [Burkholderia sp. MSMB1072]